METNKQQPNMNPAPKEKLAEKKSFFSDLFKKNKDVDNLELLETDLIKDEVEIKFEWKKDLPVAFVLFIIAFIIVVETYLFLSWWGEKREVENSHYLEREIVYIKEELEKMRTDYETSNNFKSRLLTASNVLSQHIYWTNLFTYLEKNTLKKVYYNSFSGNLSGEYILPATTDDVRAISFQSKAFLDKEMSISAEVSDEQIISESPTIVKEDGTTMLDSENSKTKVNFNLKLVLNKSILNK